MADGEGGEGDGLPLHVPRLQHALLPGQVPDCPPEEGPSD